METNWSELMKKGTIDQLLEDHFPMARFETFFKKLLKRFYS